MFCLFDLILYFPVNNFQLCLDRSSWVEPVLYLRITASCSRIQHGDAGGARTRSSRSQVKRSTTEPLSLLPCPGLNLHYSHMLYETVSYMWFGSYIRALHVLIQTVSQSHAFTEIIFQNIKFEKKNQETTRMHAK